MTGLGRRRRRKGMLEELLSKAIHADDINAYTVVYRDKNVLRELSLREFLRLSENFQSIPASRIVYVRRYGKEVYSSSTASIKDSKDKEG
ncbi:MAG: hypothetical protein RMJ59_05325 [Candidatus Nitrosocaldus sp.]|nr:hypothetical protein [Candidatus Nitrosocaldus sp.]MCS7141806.1 hypothetical protein [Candidatus Nitrosocaldus sp.]MDW8000482.1 hypothetical protein [Candidatus Nitrosocaldus sp.]MDW8275783.1 hypothetical protein [Candidatus Nitrosocaldus sp.]